MQVWDNLMVSKCLQDYPFKACVHIRKVTVKKAITITVLANAK